MASILHKTEIQVGLLRARSIPLYVLAGFAKREPEAVEASLKFFLVGTVSSAIMAYGLSFLYGMARTTQLSGVSQALETGHPLLMLGLLAVLAGFGFKIAGLGLTLLRHPQLTAPRRYATLHRGEPAGHALRAATEGPTHSSQPHARPSSAFSLTGSSSAPYHGQSRGAIRSPLS